MKTVLLLSNVLIVSLIIGCSDPLTANSPYNSLEDREFMLKMYDDHLAKWPKPFESVTISTQLGATHVLVNGSEDSPPVILFHGAMANALMWKDVVATLQNTHRTIAVDMPGHFGKSVPSKRDISDEELAEWVDQILDYFKVKKVIVIGTSFGGWVAMKYSSISNQRVEQMVLIATTPGSWKTSFGFVRKAIRANRTGKEEDVRDMVEYMHASQNKPSQEMVTFMTESMRRGKAVLPKPGKLKKEELSKVTIPVLAIAGEEDRLFSPEDLKRDFNEYFSNVEYVVIKRAGHFVFSEQVEETCRLIIDFLTPRSLVE